MLRRMFTERVLRRVARVYRINEKGDQLVYMKRVVKG